jgi:hypothetical protein
MHGQRINIAVSAPVFFICYVSKHTMTLLSETVSDIIETRDLTVTRDINAIVPGLALATYSFAANGGAIGTVSVPLGISVPPGAVVQSVSINTTTPFTSSTNLATVSLGILVAGNLQAATLVTAAPWTSGGQTTVINPSPVTAVSASSLILTIATQALTAGAFTVYVTYV